MTRLVSIFERVGRRGGGKVRAALNRTNTFSEIAAFDAVLYNFDHNARQAFSSAALYADGVLARGVRLLTVPEVCSAAGVTPFDDFPAYDETRRNGKKTDFLRGGDLVMQDQVRMMPIVTITTRPVPGLQGDRVFALYDEVVHQIVRLRQRNRCRPAASQDERPSVCHRQEHDHRYRLLPDASCLRTKAGQAYRLWGCGRVLRWRELGLSIAGAHQHLVTVSRLELTGKFIHDSIEAFWWISEEFPDVNFLIHGRGIGKRPAVATIST